MTFNHPLVALLGRLFIVYVFATSGIAKLFGWAGNVQYMSAHHLPMIPVLLAIAALIEVGGSMCLITGYRAREAAVIMFFYLAVVTVLLHNYWAASSNLAGIQETHFRKNFAIMGGLLMLAYSGPGAWSLGKGR
jgi:putative oxidoreductase